MFVLKKTSSGDWLEVRVMWSHWDSESPCLFQISYEVRLLGMGNNSCLKKPCLVVSRDWFWKIWLSKISVAELISTQIIVGQLFCGQCATLVTPSATRCHTTKVESVIGTRYFKVYPKSLESYCILSIELNFLQQHFVFHIPYSVPPADGSAPSYTTPTTSPSSNYTWATIPSLK